MKKISKQISLGYDPITGKRIRKWIHAETKAGLKQAEKDVLMQFAREGVPSKLTYKQYEKKWWEAYCTQLGPHTQIEYKGILKRNTVLHQKKMTNILRTDLQKVINENWDKPSVCARYAQLMNRIWTCAVIDNVCQKNIAMNLKVPKRVKTVRRPLTKEELAGIAKADLDTLERFMMDVLLQFGLRPQEAYALNKQSFNRKDRTLTIDKAVAYNHGKAFLKTTKTTVTRTLPVPDSFWNKIPSINRMYYFTESDGQLLSKSHAEDFQRNVLTKINKAMDGTDKLKKTEMTFYYCRHHKASLIYYLPGVSVKKKAAYMGHSETVFLQTYSHMMEDFEDSEALREAINL